MLLVVALTVKGEQRNMQISWNEPWQNDVKGSWWKAILTTILAVLTLWLWIMGSMVVNILRSGVRLDTVSELPTEELIRISGLTPMTNFIGEVLMLVVLLLLMWGFNLKLFDLKSLNWRGVGTTLLIYLATFAVMVMYGYFVLLVDPSRQTTANQAIVEQAFTGVSPLIAFFSIVIYAPMWEEIVFRGFIMKYMLPKWPLVGALVSAAVFAGMHMPAGSVWLDFGVYFILGMGLATVYWRTRKIEYAILFHFIQNLIGFLAIQNM